MLQMLSGLVSALVGFLSSVLPDSPFLDIVSGIPDSLRYGLGWLNWLVPFGPMGVLFGVWLAAVLVWRTVRFITTRLLDKAFKAQG